MADIRESLLAENLAAREQRPSFLDTWWPRLKFALRRVVVATSVPPFRSLYAGIYRLHVWYAVRAIRRLPGTRAIYVKRGAFGKEGVFGISDIDLITLGDWNDTEHAHVTDAVGAITRRSPLYDTSSVTQIHRIDSLSELYQSDYFFQFKLNLVREQGVLAFGEPILSTLPPISAESALGAYFMEAKIWWLLYTNSAFGTGPTAWDSIFRNNVAYKAVAEVSNLCAAAGGAPWESSRRGAIVRALDASKGTDAAGTDADILRRLTQCADSRFLRYDGDVIADSFQLLLKLYERLHAAFPGKRPFDPVPGASFVLDAPVEEMPQSDEARTHARARVEHAKKNWPGYKRAFLMPRNSLTALDDLQVLLEVDPARPPSLEQVRELCGIPAPPTLRQRVASYLLLENGAILLDRKNNLEFWNVLLCPQANPDVFEMLNRPEFRVDGEPRTPAPVHWSNYTARIFGDELKLRRAAFAKPNPQGPTHPLDLLRAVWRQLQLEVIAQSAAHGTVRFPLTVGAIRRGVESWGLPDTSILNELQQAYESELRGTASNAAELIGKAMGFFAHLMPKA